MVKKTLLSLAIAATAAGLAGCNISSVEKHNDNVDTTPVSSGTVGEGGTAVERTRVVYNPSATNSAGLPQIPLITDLLLQGLAGADGDCASADTATCLDGTIPFPGGDAVIGSEDYNPIFSAVGDLDGFSTSSAIDIPFEGALDASSIVTTPGPTANVILIPLNYTNDPIAGGAPENDDDPILDVSNPVGTPAAIAASVITYSDSPANANNVLRIMPTTPLQPATRYLMVVTDGLLDAEGVGVAASGTYSFLAGAKTPVADPTTASLQGAIQNWVSLARQVGGGMGQSLTTADIAYATTFTTGGTTTVLESMAAPSNINPAVAQSLPASLRLLMEQGFVNGDDTTTIVTSLVGAITAMPDGAEKTALITALGGESNMAASLGAAVTLGASLPQPAPRVSDFTVNALSVDVTLGTATGLTMANGTIKMPYYLSAPDTSNLTTTAGRVFTEFWKADDTLPTDLSALLTAAGISPAAVTAPSENVTRHFPIAKTGLHTDSETNPQGYVDVPISVFYSTACAGPYNPIIYQHGIRSNRSAAIPFAANMALEDNCNATITIDLPLHGLEPFSATGGALLKALYAGAAGGTDANQSGTADANDDAFVGMFAQRHFGLTQDINDSGKPRAMAIMSVADATANDTGAVDYNGDGDNDGTAGDFYYDNSASGSLFINLANFQNTRDNNRQAVMDLLNLNASVYTLDFDGNAGVDINPNASLKFAGHSLGAIVGTTAVALANNLQSGTTYVHPVEAAVFANGSGNLTKMLENSFAFAPAILGGLEALGAAAEPQLDMTQGTSLFELTMHVFQATIDSADPINFASMMADSSDSAGMMMFEVAGDGSANPPDLVIPPAAYAANGLAPRVLLDNVLAGEAGDNDHAADTSAAPLAGTTPLAVTAGLTAQTASVGDGSEYISPLVRFSEGSHSSFGTADDDTGAEMMKQVRTFFTSDGKQLTMTDTSVVVTE